MAERLQRQLYKLAPSHPALNLPFDSFLPDHLEDAIAAVEADKNAALAPKQDAMTEKQQDKAMALKQQYHELWMRWKDARNDCRKIKNMKSQEIMKLLPADWDETVGMKSLSVSDATIFKSFAEGKAYNDQLELEKLELEVRLDAMNAALAFAADTESQRGMRMVAVVHDDLQSFKKDFKQIMIDCVREVLIEEGLIPQPKQPRKVA
jgi:hypothetical protein